MVVGILNSILFISATVQPIATSKIINKWECCPSQLASFKFGRSSKSFEQVQSSVRAIGLVAALESKQHFAGLHLES